MQEAFGRTASYFSAQGKLLPKGTVFLMLHRIVDTVPFSADRSLYMTCKTFENLIIYLLEQGIQILSLNDWLENLIENERVCIITFDDGWADNFENAFPILRKYSVPATIFLTTGFLDTTEMFWFEKIRSLFERSRSNQDAGNALLTAIERATSLVRFKTRSLDSNSLPLLLEALKDCHPDVIQEVIREAAVNGLTIENDDRIVLSYDEINEMGKHGITFGSHGASHSILTWLSSAEKFNEISLSKAALERTGVNLCPAFSFPNGLFDPESLDMVRASGYKAAFAASIRNIGKAACPFLYSRVCFSESVCSSRDLLAYRLLKVRLRGEAVREQTHFFD